MEVEVIDKENDRMEKRFDNPIPTFIPLSHQPSDLIGNPLTTEDYHPNIGYVSGTHSPDSRILQQTPPA
jgi:hypothetical protein